MLTKSVVVFSGSKAGHDPEFMQHAKELGYLLAEEKILLVYGGGSLGLMGAVSNAAKERGGEIKAIIPKKIVELVGRNFNSEIPIEVVDDIHTRKQRMYEAADAAIALPGGFGTLDEMFEFAAWCQLGLHAKPKPLCALNTAGFFNPIKILMMDMVRQGLMDYRTRDLLQFATSPQHTLERIERAIRIQNALAFATAKAAATTTKVAAAR